LREDERGDCVKGRVSLGARKEGGNKRLAEPDNRVDRNPPLTEAKCIPREHQPDQVEQPELERCRLMQALCAESVLSVLTFSLALVERSIPTFSTSPLPAAPAAINTGAAKNAVVRRGEEGERTRRRTGKGRVRRALR
jgi:hypothetical protein